MNGQGVILGILMALAGAPQPDMSREVTLDGGKGALHGTLLTPQGAKPGAAVLLIAGSGPTDRDGNSTLPGVAPATLRLLAEGLASRGIASLRFDKRGIGASAAAGPTEFDLRFNTYVEDAAAWARLLAAQPGVRCVVIVGHSEGALVGAMAAERAPVCGLVEIAGAGRPADVVLTEQLAGVPEPLHAEALKTLADIKAGRFVARPPLPALFRPTVQPYLTSWLSLDPAEALSRVKAPVLIVQGERDLQVSVADARTLGAARPDATVLIVPTMNHVLKTAPTDRAGNLAAYADPALPLAPEVVPAVASFVERAGARSHP